MTKRIHARRAKLQELIKKTTDGRHDLHVLFLSEEGNVMEILGGEMTPYPLADLLADRSHARATLSDVHAALVEIDKSFERKAKA